MPPRIAVLPRTKEGYPIPWFVPELSDGTRDLRVMGEEHWFVAVNEGRCWVCGVPLGKWKTFLIGPMCTINRVTAEPPMHRDCAEYSARVCPFVSRPTFERRTAPLPDGARVPAGMHDDRNPGVAVTWTTRTFDVFRTGRFSTDGRNVGSGYLISIETPNQVEWWHEGRLATQAAAAFALEGGLVKLRDVAATDKHPDAALAELQRQYEVARLLLP